MNFRTILSTIKYFFESIGAFLREMVRLPHAKKYLFLSPLFIFFFLIVTFPFEIFIRKALVAMETTHFKSVNLNDVEFSFFDVARITDLNLIFRDNDEITITELIADPSLNPYRLFISKRYKSGLELSGFKYTTTTGKEYKFNLSGNIDVTLSKTDMPETGLIKFIIQNAVVNINEVNLPQSMGGFPLKIPPLKFTTITLDSKIGGKKITIERLNLAGPDLRASITGYLTIENNIQTSKLYLNLSVESDSAAISSYKELLASKTDGEGKIIIPIRGTIASPAVEFSN
jgi:hypothetical protein